MKLAEFETLLDRYGSDIALWPVEKHSSAHALLTTSSEAITIRRQAQDLEALLSAEGGVLADAQARPNAALIGRLMADFEHERAARSLLERIAGGFDTLWHTAGRQLATLSMSVIAGAAAFGIAVGAFTAPDAEARFGQTRSAEDIVLSPDILSSDFESPWDSLLEPSER